MRRVLAHAAVWALATSAGIALSWYGVHSVLAGTAYDPPRTLPIAGPPPSSATEVSMVPEASSTHRPPPPVSPASSSSATGRSASPSAVPSAHSTSRTPASLSASPSGTEGDSAASGSAQTSVHSYTLAGGQVALSLGASSATLISATPNPGWSMQVWKEDGRIRVDFALGPSTSTLYCTWNGHPPQVQTYLT